MIERTYPEVLKAGQKLWLWCLGDIGHGGVRWDEKSFSEDSRYLLAEKERGSKVRIVGIGDYLAFPSPTERAAMLATKQGKGFYETTLDAMDSDALERCDNFLRLMRPFKRDFIGLLSGHHFYDFSRRSEWYGINSDEYICKKLKCDYFGTIAKVRLVFANLRTYRDILAHHGYGSGRTKGTKIIKRGRVLEGFRAHVVLMGHDNARLAECSQVFRWDEKGKTHSEDVHIVATGAYERAYEVGIAKAGYVEESLMNPASLGAAIILMENFEGKLRCRAIV